MGAGLARKGKEEQAEHVERGETTGQKSNREYAIGFGLPCCQENFIF